MFSCGALRARIGNDVGTRPLFLGIGALCVRDVLAYGHPQQTVAWCLCILVRRSYSEVLSLTTLRNMGGVRILRYIMGWNQVYTSMLHWHIDDIEADKPE